MMHLAYDRPTYRHNQNDQTPPQPRLVFPLPSFNYCKQADVVGKSIVSCVAEDFNQETGTPSLMLRAQVKA